MSKEGMVALLVAGAAAVVIAVVVVSGRGDEDVACSLTGPAASAVVAAIHTGRGAEQIAGATIAGVLVPIACKEVITSLIETPENDVTLDLELPSGHLEPTTASGTEILAERPASARDYPAGTTVADLLNCGGWDSRILWEMCLSGDLPAQRTSYLDQLLDS